MAQANVGEESPGVLVKCKNVSTSRRTYPAPSPELVETSKLGKDRFQLVDATERVWRTGQSSCRQELELP